MTWATNGTGDADGPAPRLYRLSGFSLRSAIALPELEPAEPLTGGDRPDIEIRLGPVPDRIAPAAPTDAWFEARGGDTLLIRMPGIGRFLVTGGRGVRIDPDPAAAEADIRAILFGSVFGALLLMRGSFPLHASALRFGDGAVAFTGASGAGKSTLAAYLAEAGHRVLSDDVCVLEARDGPPLVRPSIPRIKLWAEGMDALGKPKLDANRDTFRWEKYHLRLEPVADPVPLRAVVLLESADTGGPSLHPIRGAEALTTLNGHVFRPEFVQALGLGEPVFRMAAALAGHVPVFRLRRRRDLADMAACIALLRRHFPAG